MGQSEEVLQPPTGSAGASDMGGQGSWSASHMEVAAELEHRHLATKAESHPSSRQEGVVRAGPWGVRGPNPERRPGNRSARVRRGGVT